MLPPTHETRLQHEATASSNGHSMPPPTHETRLQHETAASSNAPDKPPVMSSSRRILALITSHIWGRDYVHVQDFQSDLVTCLTYPQ